MQVKDLLKSHSNERYGLCTGQKSGIDRINRDNYGNNSLILK